MNVLCVIDSGHTQPVKLRAGLPLFFALNSAQHRSFKGSRVAHLHVGVFENFLRAGPGCRNKRLIHICHLSAEHQTRESSCFCVCLTRFVAVYFFLLFLALFLSTLMMGVLHDL